MRQPFDVAGGALSAITLGALIMAANSFSHADNGHFSSQTLLDALAYAVAAMLAGIAFVWRQRRAPKPLLPLGMFASSRFSLAALTSLASFVSQGITFVALPFLFQNVYGYSAFTSALLFTRGDWHYPRRAERRKTGRPPFARGDFNHRAGDIRAGTHLALFAAGTGCNVGYLFAQSGVRHRVWLLPKPQ
ncbi:drug resistance MFS transporter, drug:H+ antiporter-2 (14 Spanner) (DHA2) family [Ewingella americana]|uniref:Drug resistance MFS transporter, drug:H+ antiporter-2 (14 Spanner) (DHA2) family n=1 Tax=Ewingella americana TaxID=41202 RepID=A0A377TDJ0_9GAMM|nr:drug resistance MFS transporter, drug:H+ antiporter-2 (14 Spanner) (DHA2) family [Ewingella americana]